MKRRELLAGGATIGLGALAGCLSGVGGGSEEPPIKRRVDCEAGVVVYTRGNGAGYGAAAVPLNETDLNESEVCDGS